MKDVAVPVPAAHEVRIKIAYTGICGTDLHIIKDEFKANLPVIMGHEFSGTIDAAGSNVSGFAAGDPVVSLTVGSICGQCDYCNRGVYMQCSQRKSIGTHMNGAMAEYLVMDATRVFHIPPGVSLREAALLEPTACVVRSVVEMSNVRAGDSAYVSGPGTIGQLAAQILKACGAYVVVGGVAQDAERLALAKRLGADETLIVTDPGLGDRVRSLTKGKLFDVAYECAGAVPSANTCLELLRPCGQYVQIGIFGRPITFDMDKALKRQNHIVNSFASERSSWNIALRLLAQGKLHLGELISAEYALADWKEAVDAAMNKTGFKVLLKPDAD